MTISNWLQLILLGAIWGNTFIFVELLLIDFPVGFIVFVRVFVSALALLLITLILRYQLPRKTSEYLCLAVMGFFANALPFTLITHAQVQITAGLTSILNSNVALVTVFLAPLLIKLEVFQVRKVLGALIGVSGVTIAVGYENLFLSNVFTNSPILVILATLSYAVSIVWAKLFLSHLRITITGAFMLLFASMYCLLYLILSNEINHVLPQHIFHIYNIQYFLALSLLCTAFAYLLFFSLINKTGASNAALVTIIVPMVALITELLILQQYPKINEVVGFLVIALALLIIDGRLFAKLRNS